MAWFESEHAYPNLGAIFGSGVKVVVDEELGTNVLGESIAELQRSKMTSATRKHTKSRAREAFRKKMEVQMSAETCDNPPRKVCLLSSASLPPSSSSC